VFIRSSKLPANVQLHYNIWQQTSSITVAGRLLDGVNTPLLVNENRDYRGKVKHANGKCDRKIKRFLPTPAKYSAG